MNSSLFFTGDALRHAGARIERPGKPPEFLDPYQPAADLVEAVNLCLLLGRPLLLMGEPGCGKSRLARVLAYELYRNQPGGGEIEQDYRPFYAEWLIKSSSKAQEGLYEYDAIGRLGDAQVLAQTLKKGEDPQAALSKKKYITEGPMGRALRNTTDADHRVVLLIDEIDKANLDFPNDLLNELDRAEFVVRETGETVSAASGLKPIIIVTSNGEKELPDAFLRRCLFHFIQPFDEARLRDIVSRRYYPDGPADQDLVDAAASIFVQVRGEITKNKLTVGKNTSTAEFIDWFSALKHHPSGLELLRKARKPDGSLDVVPFQQALFKHQATLLNFKSQPTG